jgi:uncharacterized membrane protein
VTRPRSRRAVRGSVDAQATRHVTVCAPVRSGSWHATHDRRLDCLTMIVVLADLAGLAAMTGGVLGLVRVAYSARWPGTVAAEPHPDRSRHRPVTPEHRHRGHHGTFGNDRFGVLAERFARAFGTPQFIVGQTVFVALWIGANAVAVGLRWDPYPFILLNLAFSTQAAYAAPLILLAQTRQAERDKLRDAAVQAHRDAQARHQDHFESELRRMLERDGTQKEARQALLARQGALIDEIARALRVPQASSGTEIAGVSARAARAPRGAPFGS